MTAANAVPRSARVIRWIARIWSILVTTGALLIVFSPDPTSPDPSSTEPMAAVDWFIVSLLGLAFLGLFIAWRWERVGGIFTLAMLFIREIAWVILKGNWFAGFLIFWLLIAPPAILFLIAWRLERKTKKIES